MLLKSNLLAQASGSLAGTVFSHNAGGMYTRSRSIPTNPNTPAQQAIRTALKQLTTRWGQVLTPAQRQAWATYAANVPLLSKLGDSRPVSALAMYVRCNSPRYYTQGPSAIVDDGPTIFAMATFTACTVALSSGDISLHFTNTDDWATAAGGYLLVYASAPQSQTINYFKGPFLLTATILGASPTAPVSPHDLTPPGGVQPGNRYFFRITASDADGRLSSDQIITFDMT